MARDSQHWIEVTREEQSLLGTNVLSLDEYTIISRKHEKLKKLNNKIREHGIEVIELPFDGATATGGSFRCCSMPLVRQQ
ncbi:MAG: arginine deiminase family protein [Fulvivirga sp.]|nr:arginine deiminase family protein [Fulvivirga sp.]